MVSFIIINPSHTSFVDLQTCFTFVCSARVHFQHSAELLSRLVKVEANYTLQLYPDEGHCLREERSNQHLHRTLLHYLQNCLKYDPFLNTEEEEEDDEEEEWSLPLCPLSVFRGAQFWCLTLFHQIHQLFPSNSFLGCFFVRLFLFRLQPSMFPERPGRWNTTAVVHTVFKEIKHSIMSKGPNAINILNQIMCKMGKRCMLISLDVAAPPCVQGWGKNCGLQIQC